MLHVPSDHLQLKLVISPLVIDEPNGHSQHTPVGNGVAHDYHLKVFVAKGLGTPATRGLLHKKALN